MRSANRGLECRRQSGKSIELGLIDFELVLVDDPDVESIDIDHIQSGHPSIVEKASAATAGLYKKP